MSWSVSESGVRAQCTSAVYEHGVRATPSRVLVPVLRSPQEITRLKSVRAQDLPLFAPD